MLGQRFVQAGDTRAHGRLHFFKERHVPRKHRKGLMHVAGPEAEHAISGLQALTDLQRQSFPVRLRMHALMPVPSGGIHHGFPAYPGDRRLAGRIDVRDKDQIRVLKCGPELLLEGLGARVPVRLEHDQHPVPAGAAGCSQRGTHLGGMMTVIVHEHVTIAPVLDLEPAAGTTETLEGLGNPRERDADLHGKRDCSQCVAHVVPARHIQSDGPEGFTSAQHPEMGLEILGVHIVKPVEGRVGTAVGNRPRMHRAGAGRVWIIRAENDLAPGLADELRKHAFNRLQVPVMVEVFLLDVQNNRMLGPVQHEGAIALVALRHKIFPCRIPVRVGPKNGNFRAHIMRGTHPPHTQHMGRHSRGCGLSVHPGHHHAAPALHKGRQRISPTHHPLATVHCRPVIPVRTPNRRRVNHQFRLGHSGGLVRTVKLESQPLQALHFHRADFVTPAHTVPECQK